LLDCNPPWEETVTTIRDVARVAGVSIATVSRVFNGSPRVSDPTRQRVWSATEDLDYWPNNAARTLTTNRTHTLGVLLPDLCGEFFSEVIRGIDLAAREEGFQILVSSSHTASEALVSAAQLMRGRVDGLVMMASEVGYEPAIVQIRRRLPVILLNPRQASAGCGSVTVANFDGALAAVEHLIGLGHRTIAMVQGPSSNGDAGERLRGYRRGLEVHGLQSHPGLEFPGNFTESSGYRAALALMAMDPRPSAFFAANDKSATGVLSALRSLGVAVPGDVAVVGFDDIGMARYLDPPLTTVRVDAFELGKRGVLQLLTQLRSPDDTPCRQETLPATLVVRRSCGSHSHTTLDMQRSAGDRLPEHSGVGYGRSKP
jgi:LacI family transcriptional regulator